MIIKRKRVVAILMIFIMMFSAFSTLLASANEVDVFTDEELAVEENMEAENEEPEPIEEDVTNDTTEEIPKRIIFDEKPDDLIDDLELLQELNVQLDAEEKESLKEDSEEMMSTMNFSPMAVGYPVNIKFKMVDTTGKRLTTGQVRLSGNGVNITRGPDSNGIVDFGRLNQGVYKLDTVTPPTGTSTIYYYDEVVVRPNTYFIQTKYSDGYRLKATSYDIYYEVADVEPSFKKVDDLGNPLEGAEFELRGKDLTEGGFGLPYGGPLTQTRIVNQYLDPIATENTRLCLFLGNFPVTGFQGGETISINGDVAQNMVGLGRNTYTMFLTARFETNYTPGVGSGFTAISPVRYTEFLDVPLNDNVGDYTFILNEAGAVPQNTLNKKLWERFEDVTYKATSDSSGRVQFPSLQPGRYELVETVIPDYHEGFMGVMPSLGENKKEVTVTHDGKILDGDGNHITEIVNKRTRGYTRLYKHDEEGNPLEGAEFLLEGNGISVVLTSSERGTMWQWLYKGVYTLTETKAPNGYELDGKPKKLEILPPNYPKNQFDTKIFIDDIENNIIINKELPSTSHLKLYKKDKSSNETLSGAVFELKGTSVDKTVTSNNNGLMDFDEIPYGTYTLTETKAPTGYFKLENNIVVKLELVNGSPKITLDGVETDTILNEREKTTVILEKEDAETNRKLEGAVFNLKGNGVDKNFTSNTNGQINLGEIPVGTYTLTETKAPTGYQLDNTPKTMVVTKTTVTINGTQGKTLYNTSLKSAFHINKVDEAGRGLQGATFKLVGLGVDKTATSGTDGKVDFGMIPYGTYTLTETKAPDNYILDSKPKEVVIGDVITVDGSKSTIIANKLAVRTIGIKKVNTDDEVLSGAKFLLEGNGLSIEKITNTEGLAIFPNIPFGDYTIKEVEAPKGYRILPKPQEIKIDADTEIADDPSVGYDKLITVVNYRSDEALPDTGTLGMLPYLLIGGILIVGGLFVYKRKDKESRTK